MKLRSSLAGTAVLVALLGAGNLSVGPLMKSAHAQAAISINVFYDELADHGDWVQYEDRYVFVPADIEVGWRPYTLGHWVYADRFGWTWVSDEPFGWATYHYGRWGYSEEIGWYWVPGRVWAPAWVSWKRTRDHVVWAPLPVDRGYDYDDADIRIDVSVGDIPDYYWVVVPAPRFLEANLNVVIINDDRDRVRIVREAEPLGSVRIVNNVVVNNVVNVNFIEEETGRDVEEVKVRETNDPREARSTDDEVVAVPDRIGREENAKPSKISNLEEVEERAPKLRRDETETGSGVVDQKDAEPGAASDDQAQGSDSQEEKGTVAGDEDGKSRTNAGKQVEDTGQATDEAVTGDGGATGKKAKRKRVQDESASESQGIVDEQDVRQGENQQSGQKMKRKNRNAESSDTQGAVEDGQQNGQKAKRKKRNAEQRESQGVIQDGDDGRASGQKQKKAQGVIDQQDQIQQGQGTDQSPPKRRKPKAEQSESQGNTDQSQSQAEPQLGEQEAPAFQDSADQQPKASKEKRKKKPVVEKVQP